ncbi:CAP domain-containing protein [Streptomyces mobaraensis]|nr:CAP domain-containing protein [Streptomyces mobaraensis]
MCRINAERATAGVPVIADYNPALQSAAADHVRAARDLKWWAAGSDPHTNPVTHSTPASRAQSAGYGAGAVNWQVREVTYNGWGGDGTPRAAVHWWVHVSTAGHREIVLGPQFTEFGCCSLGGNADPAGNGQPNAGTFVCLFGFRQ